MNPILDEAIEASIALLTQDNDFAEAPLGYGSDISGAEDLDPDMNEVDPFSTLALSQAIARRLDCPRGGLPDDQDYGIDVRSYCNRGVTAAEINSLGGQIRGELLKDDRVDTLTVVVTPSDSGRTLAIEIRVTPVDPNTGDFTLTLSANDTSVIIEDIQSELGT